MDDRINRIKPDKEVDRDWQETVSTISAVQEGAVPENGEEKNKYLFEKMPVPQALAAMAVPTVISQLIVLIYNMADTFYIGRTNNPYMVAGAALILPIFNVCIAFSSIAGAGGGTLIARLMGAGQTEKARRVASFSIWFSVFTALFFAIMTALFMRPLLTFLGASAQTFEYARQYCSCVIMVGAVPTITAMTMGNLLRNVGCSKQAVQSRRGSLFPWAASSTLFWIQSSCLSCCLRATRSWGPALPPPSATRSPA